MRLRYTAAPWAAPELTPEAAELADILADDVWSESSVEFYAKRDAKIRLGKRAPKGMQKTLNAVIDRKLTEAGWLGDSGYYVKGSTWARITFRHQMSIGSDFLDALKVCKKQGMELAVIIAANRETLDVITPNDAAALVSFEKLRSLALDLDGAMDIPLLIGELTPMTFAPSDIDAEIRKYRPRDTTVSSESLPS